MGFPEEPARQAAARYGSDVGAAVDWLTGPGDMPAAASGSCGACGSSASLATAEEEAGQCSICTEDLLLQDAAMRCSGHGGKKHYFHSHCLAAWVRQCKRTGASATCPECRGPVQVRPRRLEEFLRKKGGCLDEEDHEAMRSLSAAAEHDADDAGWSNIRQDLWKVGAAVAIGAGVAVVLAAGIHMLTKREEERGSSNGRRR
mmetsp:Transcript_79138/g.177311  ORF Transcript_79138/g.177311 Transcript_79138/m.177311 type:complete len:202 (-) Transcript_79138:26-631(-)